MPTVLHLIKNEKFIPAFLEFVQAQDFAVDQSYLIWDKKRNYPLPKTPNAKLLTGNLSGLVGLLGTVGKLYRSQRIIVHSLFGAEVLVLLFLQPWLLHKCYWIIWGGDLYAHKLSRRTAKWHLQEFLKRPIIRRVGHLVTAVEGDAALAREWYGATGQFHESFVYPSNLFRPMASQPESGPSVTIMVGNSADPTNNHAEILERLPHDRQINVIVPLSYAPRGSEAYIQSILDLGRRRFGERFQPLTEFLPLDDYFDILANVDIAIFNHDRQQAMANIITMLGLGKKVYLKQGTTHWAFFERKSLTIFDCRDIDLEPMDPDVARQNETIVRDYFSPKTLAGQMRELFTP